MFVVCPTPLQILSPSNCVTASISHVPSDATKLDGILECHLPSEFSRQCKSQEGNYLEFHTQSCEEFFRSEEMRRRDWFGFPDSPGDIRIDRNTIHSKSA
jgi:hypothetical protein